MWLNFATDCRITEQALEVPTNFSERLSRSGANTLPESDSLSLSDHQSEGDSQSRTYIMYPTS